MRLANKTAVITGASRGIGAAIAQLFAAQGAQVVVNFHSSAEIAEQVVADIRASGGAATAIQADVRKPDDVQDMMKKTLSKYGGLDILVNNAGWAVLQPLEAISPKELNAQLSLNICGLIYATQAATACMRNHGRVVNISSIAANGGAGGSVYSATKAACNVLTKCHAQELGARGITVNAVAPAAVETDLYYEVGLDKNREANLAATPLGRIGTVTDVANAALFFASDEAAWITGEIMQVSGGRGM